MTGADQHHAKSNDPRPILWSQEVDDSKQGQRQKKGQAKLQGQKIMDAKSQPGYQNKSVERRILHLKLSNQQEQQN